MILKRRMRVIIMIRINMLEQEVVEKVEKKRKKRKQSEDIMMMMMMMIVMRMKKRLRNRLKRKQEGSHREVEVQRKDLQKRKVSLEVVMMPMADQKEEIGQDQNQKRDQRKRLVIQVMIALNSNFKLNFLYFIY